VLSQAVGSEELRDLAEMLGTELLVIDGDTTVRTSAARCGGTRRTTGWPGVSEPEALSHQAHPTNRAGGVRRAARRRPPAPRTVDAMDDRDLVETLLRWERSGAVWQVVTRNAVARDGRAAALRRRRGGRAADDHQPATLAFVASRTA
jgi:hypothetical protein